MLTFISVLTRLGGFRTAARELFSRFLARLRWGRAKRIKKTPEKEFVDLSASLGLKVFAFGLDKTITAGESLGAMPPKDVAGSEESWEKMEKVSEGFVKVVEAMAGWRMRLCIVTSSDEEIKDQAEDPMGQVKPQIMDSDEWEKWLQHHYKNSPPEEEGPTELMAKAVAGDDLVRQVLLTKDIKPAMVVALNPK